MTLEEYTEHLTFNRTLRKTMLFENVFNGSIDKHEFLRIVDWLQLSDHWGDEMANKYMREGRI